MIDEMKKKYSAPQGFTLIEMTMVIFILGLLMASFLDPLATRVEQEQRNSTQIQLDVIEEILYGYVLQNQALPCPDCADNTGGCAAATADDGVADQTVGQILALKELMSGIIILPIVLMMFLLIRRMALLVPLQRPWESRFRFAQMEILP